jgi:hypothetical protein
MSELPWLPSVVRAFLMGQPNFTGLIVGARVVYKAPPDVTTPYVRIQVPNAAPMSGDSVAFRPLVQVDAYCPAGATNADKTVWDLVSAASWSLSRARNVVAGSLSWSGRHLDGPIPDIDKSRGDSSPLTRAVIRAELTLHAR